jgi:hypothetical protein
LDRQLSVEEENKPEEFDTDHGGFFMIYTDKTLTYQLDIIAP